MRDLRLSLSLTVLVGVGVGALTAGGAPATRVGSVTGSIAFNGVAPAAAAVQMQADPFCASSHDTEVFASPIEVGEAGGLGNVVVYVTAAGSNESTEPALLSQIGPTFCLAL